MYWELHDTLSFKGFSVVNFQIFNNTLAVALVQEKRAVVEVRLYDLSTLKLRSSMQHNFKAEGKALSIDPDLTRFHISNDVIVFACTLFTDKYQFSQIHQAVKWNLIDGTSFQICTPDRCTVISDEHLIVEGKDKIWLLPLNKFEKELWSKINVLLPSDQLIDQVAVKNNQLAIGMSNGQLQVWNISQSTMIFQKSLNESQKKNEAMNSLFFLDNTILSSLSHLGSKLINLNGEIIKEFPAYNEAGFGKNSFILASKKTLIKCDHQGNPLSEIAIKNCNLDKITVSPNENVVAIRNMDGQLVIWSEDSIQMLELVRSYHSKFVFTPDNSTIIGVNGKRHIELFKTL